VTREKQKTRQAKGGRTSARKAPRAARTKPDTLSSALQLPAFHAIDLPQQMIVALSLERATLQAALRDSLHFYDRVAGLAVDGASGSGWTAADVQRMNEIRALACPVKPPTSSLQPPETPVPGVSRPIGRQTVPISYGKAPEGPKTPPIGS